MHSPDVLATVTLLPTSEGGKKTSVRSGYRPDHRIREDYLTCGIHRYIDKERVNPGQTVRTEISFIDPKAYPHCLWVGKIVTIQEGVRIVGHADILAVYNPILKAP
ncbi:MAG: hypothetical protein AAF268_08565 [Cyanobacteria bacterium P01_A01_bin.3]